jgi:hypothetical protein
MPTGTNTSVNGFKISEMGMDIVSLLMGPSSEETGKMMGGSKQGLILLKQESLGLAPRVLWLVKKPHLSFRYETIKLV